MDQLQILVVDDNHINRLYLKTILTQWHHHVTEVDCGLNALTICQQHPFDLILMDIRMQPMDGVTAAEKIKQLDRHITTPIIAVSAEHIDCTPYPQLSKCLIKPISKSMLKELIDEYSASRQATVKDPKPFDEDRALAISHHDPDIVQKLRSLFIEELPKEIKKIEQLHHSELWQDLENRLHYLQGSARVCAAVAICQTIKNYRHQLSAKSFNNLDRCLTELQKTATDVLTGDHKNVS